MHTYCVKHKTRHFIKPRTCTVRGIHRTNLYPSDGKPDWETINVQPRYPMHEYIIFLRELRRKRRRRKWWNALTSWQKLSLYTSPCSIAGASTDSDKWDESTEVT